jgi:hypothetical protein
MTWLTEHPHCNLANSVLRNQSLRCVSLPEPNGILCSIFAVRPLQVGTLDIHSSLSTLLSPTYMRNPKIVKREKQIILLRPPILVHPTQHFAPSHERSDRNERSHASTLSSGISAAFISRDWWWTGGTYLVQKFFCMPLGDLGIGNRIWQCSRLKL